MFSSFQVMTPMLHRLNYGEHFTIVDIVVALCRRALARPISDRVQTARVRLRNDTGQGQTRGISVERDRELGIEVTEDRFGGKEGLKAVEGFLRAGVPFEVLTLTEECGDRDDGSGIAFYEATIEVSKAEEYLDLGNRTGNRPLSDCGDAIGVHVNPVRGDNKFEEIDSLDVEFAFLELDVEAMFVKGIKDEADLSDVLFQGI